jgi:predicted N-acetyltransferase YhbS
VRRGDAPAVRDVRDAAHRMLARIVLDHDLHEPGQREQHRVADLREQRPHLVGGDLVAQLEDDSRVVTRRRGTLGGQR